MTTSTTFSFASLSLSFAKGLALAAAPFVVVGCCSGVEDPDDQLLVEITDEAPALEQSSDAPALTNVCGADVIAKDEAGTEIAMTEVVLPNADGSSRCGYIATVDPGLDYSVVARKDDRVAELPYATSNPACSVKTDPADTDGIGSLISPTPAYGLESYADAPQKG